MTRWVGRHRLRLHRSTVLVLVLAVVGTVLGTAFTRDLVEQSEHRLLQQKAGAAAIIMSSLLAQSYTPAVQALGAAVKADGTVDPMVFGGTSAALRAPEPTSPSQQGGMGASATAVLDLRNGRVAASSGRLVLVPTSPPGLSQLAAAAGVAAKDPAHVAFVGLIGTGTARALGMLALAGEHTAGYLEVPFHGTVDVGALEAAPQYNQAFGGLDFAIYYGNHTPSALMWTNEADRHLDGYTAEVFVGLTSSSGFEGTSYDSGRRPLMIALEAREPLTGQFSHRFPWLMLAFGLLTGLAVMVLTEKTQRGKDRAYSLVGQLEARNAEVEEEVRRRQQAEERLRQSQRLEAVGQLAGGIAHDFNNLLAVIFSYAGFLKNEAQGQPWAEDVEEIDKAAHRAAELTQQLLMFSRRESSRASVVDARGLIADRFRLLRRTLSEDIEVALELPDHPVNVCADAVELDQVVMNLVVNARDAMPAGGTLTLGLSEVATESGGVEVQLSVVDTGVGMDAEVKEHAFEPFFTTKEVGRGTGLGLATVYGIVTRWGGSVSLSSTPGQGTAVTVRLPRSDEPVEAAPAATPTHHRDVTVGTVLVVEDEPSVRRATERILTSAGYTVVLAATGPEALERFADQRVDVLVSDVVMPGGMSGADLAEQLRLLQPDLPVVLASGHSRDHLSRRGPLPDDTQLLRKPFSAEVLVDAVQRSLNREGAAT